MYIGIDLGATNVRIAGSKSLDNIVFDDVQRFQLSHDFEKDFQKIIELIKIVSLGDKIEAIGMGTPGTHAEDKKSLISARNLPEWVSVPFAERLSVELNCPISVDNDGVVGSLGEAVYGQGKNKNFIYITWGSGVGGAQVENKNGNIDSQKIPTQAYLEDLNVKCGGISIASRFGKDAADINESQWNEVLADFESNFLDIADKLSEKEIIMGGGATAKQKERMQKVIENLATKGISLQLSDLNDDVGLYGAFALIKSKL